MRRNPAIVLAILSALPSTYAQAHADGLIVPFSSGLPVCASQCGILFDVQGKCTPPNIPPVDSNCFCTDSRLTPIDALGNAGVAQICTAASCTTDADLSAVKSWFDSYCATKMTPTTTGSSPGATSTGSHGGGSLSGGGGNQSWLAGHYKWVIMLVIIIFLIVGGWIAACMLRRRYIRKKEKEFEMRPPVAWGPHQLQGMTGGYNYGDGVSDANRAGKSNGPYNKEAAAIATPADAAGGKRESRGLKKKHQFT